MWGGILLAPDAGEGGEEAAALPQASSAPGLLWVLWCTRN